MNKDAIDETNVDGRRLPLSHIIAANLWYVLKQNIPGVLNTSV